MSAEDNKALIRRGIEQVMNQRKLELLPDIIAPTFVNYDMPLPTPGPGGFRQVIQPFFTAFPDFHISIEDMVAEGDKVMTRGVFTGTHRGEFMGMPATGKSISVPYMDAWRVENGKAIENWVRIDLLGLMQQLGAIPAPEQPPV